MFEDINNNQRLVVIVLATSIVAAVFFTIFLLVLVWFPIKKTDNNKEERVITEKLGTYTRKDIAEMKVMQNYCTEILDILASENMDLINNIILPEYLEFRKISKEDLKRTLKQRGVIGKRLNFSTYKAIMHPNYGKVYEIGISTYDNTFNDKMMIIEQSANDYKISFDGFIGSTKTSKTVTVDGLQIEIKEIKELANLTQVNFALKNNSGHNLIINKENNYEVVYLKLTSGSEIRINSSWLSGETKELISGHVINLNAEFVTSGFNSGVGKSIVIKNIHDTLSRESKDIEFPIY